MPLPCTVNIMICWRLFHTRETGCTLDMYVFQDHPSILACKLYCRAVSPFLAASRGSRLPWVTFNVWGSLSTNFIYELFHQLPFYFPPQFVTSDAPRHTHDVCPECYVSITYSGVLSFAFHKPFDSVCGTQSQSPRTLLPSVLGSPW